VILYYSPQLLVQQVVPWQQLRIGPRADELGTLRAAISMTTLQHKVTVSVAGVPVKRWLRRIRGAVGMGLLWGALWAAVGALNGVLVGPNGSMDGLWLGPPVGMFPGFVAGVMFSAVLGIAAAPRRLHELSIAQAGAWGGMVGMVLGVLPFAINKPPSEFPLWLVAGAVIGSFTLMGAISAAGSLALARRAKIREDVVRQDWRNEPLDRNAR